MIKITRTPKPVELTPQYQQKMTDEFKTTGKAVWNVDFIKTALLAMSSDKCCFCEIHVKEESKFMEVEHFHHKNKYQDEVLEWNNLLPSCKRCNGKKKEHDTYVEPIVNPTVDDPRDHFFYKDYRLKPKSVAGGMTISVLNLNDQERLCIPRFKIGNEIHTRLEDLLTEFNAFQAAATKRTQARNKILRQLKAIMSLALPESEYSAFMSTVILECLDYKELKDGLEKATMWDRELTDLETSLLDIRFDVL